MGIYPLVVLFLFSIDILTKWFVAFFGFPHVRNYGLLFGFIEDRGGLSLILGAISILTVVIFLRKRNTMKVDSHASLFGRPLRPLDPTWVYTVRVWSGTIFLSGALGNFITRLLLGYIIDFLPGGFTGRFFNLADIYLFTGLAGIIISEMR